MQQFPDLGSLNSHIAFEVRDRLRALGHAAEFGASNVSPSAYVQVRIADDAEPIKLRFSDHADRNGADRTWRTDHEAVVIYSWTRYGAPTLDEDGEPMDYPTETAYGPADDMSREGVSEGDAEFDRVEIEPMRLAEIIAEAVAMATGRLSPVAA